MAQNHASGHGSKYEVHRYHKTKNKWDRIITRKEFSRDLKLDTDRVVYNPNTKKLYLNGKNRNYSVIIDTVRKSGDIGCVSIQRFENELNPFDGYGFVMVDNVIYVIGGNRSAHVA